MYNILELAETVKNDLSEGAVKVIRIREVTMIERKGGRNLFAGTLT